MEKEQKEANTPKKIKWQDIIKPGAEIKQEETKRTNKESTRVLWENQQDR